MPACAIDWGQNLEKIKSIDFPTLVKIIDYIFDEGSQLTRPLIFSEI